DALRDAAAYTDRTTVVLEPSRDRLRHHLPNLVDFSIQPLILEDELLHGINAQTDLDAVLEKRRIPHRTVLQAVFSADALENGDAGGVGGDAVAAGDDELGLGGVALGRAAEDKRLAAVQDVQGRRDAQVQLGNARDERINLSGFGLRVFLDAAAA